MLHSIELLFYSSDPLLLIVWATLYFLGIYVGTSTLVWMLAGFVNRPIDLRPFSRGQIISEIFTSLRSVLLFGLGMIAPWAMIRFGWAHFASEDGYLRVITEVIVLILWNDLHFYLMHRLLHKYLKRLHARHHKSFVATPFSSYSMGMGEALILGSVMPLAMLIHDFSIISLFLLPIWSITINTLAHSNCAFFPPTLEKTWMDFIHHHQAHHSRYHGNYSFFFGQLDKWLGSDQSSMGPASVNKGHA